MGATVKGRRVWGGSRDNEGHRTYTLQSLIECTSTSDGPAVVMNAVGLPATGDPWNFGNDIDIWAFCSPKLKVSLHEHKPGQIHVYWIADQEFTTKPLNRCQDETIEDPLLIPQKISGTFTKYTEEATRDRNDTPIRTSSHEQMRGKQVEFDANRPTVRIEQNVAALGLATFSQMVDTVNDSSLWGLDARKIKLSNAAWERKFYGTCYVYFTRTFEFDINYKGFDRVLLDEGSKVLSGRWDLTTGEWVDVAIGGESPDPANPSHFIQYKDLQGENARVVLNGEGLPASASYGTGSTGGPGSVTVEKYAESNFLTLGIPTDLE